MKKFLSFLKSLCEWFMYSLHFGISSPTSSQYHRLLYLSLWSNAAKCVPVSVSMCVRFHMHVWLASVCERSCRVQSSYLQLIWMYCHLCVLKAALHTSTQPREKSRRQQEAVRSSCLAHDCWLCNSEHLFTQHMTRARSRQTGEKNWDTILSENKNISVL